MLALGSLAGHLVCAAAMLAGAAQQKADETIKEIRIETLKYTRRETVERELASAVGSTFGAATARKDLERLDRLGIFSSIEVQGLHQSDGVVLDVQVKETFPYLPAPSIDVTDADGFSIGGGFKSVNMFGKAIKLDSAARFGGATSVEVRLRDPWVAGNHVNYMVEYFFWKRFNTLDEFDELSHEFNGRLGTYIGEHGRIGGLASLLSVGSRQDGITLDPDNRDNLGRVGFFVGYDSRDLWSAPREGWWNELQLARTFGDGDYWTLDVDIRRFQPLADRHQLAIFSLTTLRSGDVGVDIPLHDDFHLGGSNTIRGWEDNSRVGKNQTINTLEYRYSLLPRRELSFRGFRLYLGLQLAFFGDLGLAWNEGDELRGRNLIGGYGVGLRLFVPWINMIRFDVAWGQPNEGTFTHFSILEKAERQRRRVR